MFSNLSNFLVLALCGSISAQNLRNGPTHVGADLGGFIGSTGGNAESNRRLAMTTLMMRELADFDWEVQPEPDFPTIAFENAGSGAEIRFKYNYTGTTSDFKYLRYSILQGDCETAGSAGALNVLDVIDITQDKEYQFDIDVLQETITETPEYTDIDVSSAMINFCVRVDYYYDEEGDGIVTPADSINFHETNVTINIDLTANFTLTDINVERIDADQIDEDVNLDCQVKAYFCDDEYNALTNPLFVQGDLMPVCVEIDDTDRALYHLNDVLEMDVEQTKSDDPLKTDSSQIVLNQLATGLSDKFCKNGICRMRHQLASKFFDERNPNNLDIAGIAICAFGPLSLYTRRADRTYTSTFIDAHSVETLNNQASVEACKDRCEIQTDCNSFAVVTDENGLFDCTLIIGAGSYPTDDDVEVNTDTVVYARNDASAVVTV